MRNYESFKVNNVNSMTLWHKVRNPFVIAFNFVIIETCKYLPSLALKRFFYSLIGIKLGKNVSIGLGVMFDIFFPELIEIGDNSIIGYNSLILTHEFLIEEWRKGKVKIGKNVLIGVNVSVLPGIEIGDNATVSSASLVNKNVNAGSFVGGVPIKELKR
ncbi:acyltransferase [Candidatus Micrarchaeota archaeon]|nr:acyltransferase [Candidatus Micrarchaeota archaeon]